MFKPTLLHYYVADICNAKCEFCNIWENKDANLAKLDDVKQNLLDAKELGCKFVDFTGGEPLLNKHLSVFLEEAKKLGFVTSVTTNTILFPKYVKNLVGKVDLLHFSLDADDRELHDKIRGLDSYDSVINAIEVALDNGMSPDLLFTYTNENINKFKGVWELARSNKLMVILDPLFSTNGTDSLLDETNKKAIEYSKLPGVYLNKAHIRLRKNGGNNTSNHRCYVTDSTIVILPENRLALPCYHNSLEKLDINGDLKNIVKSDKYNYYRDNQGKLDICNGCNINCYMDPSYGYKFDNYFIDSALSKLKYGIYKYGFYHQKMNYSLIKTLS